MGRKKFYLKGAKKLTMIQQQSLLKYHFPSSECSIIRDQSLSWKGYIQPTPCSQKYLIYLKYQRGKRPDIFVLSPKLEKWNGQKIPHTFSGERLCLYRNIYGEWTTSKPIATTIIPWTSLWLYYYEIWLSTGEWLGGGEHPNEDKDED